MALKDSLLRLSNQRQITLSHLYHQPEETEERVSKRKQLFFKLFTGRKYLLPGIKASSKTSISEHSTLLQRLSNVVQTSWAFGQRSVEVVLTSRAHWVKAKTGGQITILLQPNPVVARFMTKQNFIWSKALRMHLTLWEYV